MILTQEKFNISGGVAWFRRIRGAITKRGQTMQPSLPLQLWLFPNFTNIKTFTQGVLATQSLRRIQTGEFEYEWEWEGDLNKTIEALSIPGNGMK